MLLKQAKEEEHAEKERKERQSRPDRGKRGRRREREKKREKTWRDPLSEEEGSEIHQHEKEMYPSGLFFFFLFLSYLLSASSSSSRRPVLLLSFLLFHERVKRESPRKGEREIVYPTASTGVSVCTRQICMMISSLLQSL